MMREIGTHDNDKVARAEVEAMDLRSPKKVMNMKLLCWVTQRTRGQAFLEVSKSTQQFVQRTR